MASDPAIGFSQRYPLIRATLRQQSVDGLLAYSSQVRAIHRSQVLELSDGLANRAARPPNSRRQVGAPSTPPLRFAQLEKAAPRFAVRAYPLVAVFVPCAE